MTGMSPLVGPGSQPSEDDGTELQYMEMPKAMRTYSAPSLPEPEEIEDISHALSLLQSVADAAQCASADPNKTQHIDITDLDAQNRAFIDQALGEGEVSIVAGAALQVQESVLAGIWRIQETDSEGHQVRDVIEVGAFPSTVLDTARSSTLGSLRSHRGPLPQGVLNAPALVTELDDKIANFVASAPAHVINLTLLPQTDEDLSFLEERLGPGLVTILSRGYGNCRITSTSTANVWWVRYFNSRDAIVLNTIEVVEVPDVACAAPEDLKDSADRLRTILEIYQ
ncbi:MAG: hydrogenase expression/formation protein [Hyphomicrobiaceae bacterium]|nr:hydrogenase expression/formation protein [Hyphomicrobiaceae bacterium]